MANSTPDFFSDSIHGGARQIKPERTSPKKKTIDFILAYSKSIEFIKPTSVNKKFTAEVNLN